MMKYIKPTLDTKFHIDFGWWSTHDQSLKNFLQDQACDSIRLPLQNSRESQTFDWVHPITGEVFTIDILWHQIRQACLDHDSFITEYTPLTTAIFRAFMVNNNTPLTPTELYQIIQKQSPGVILSTISRRVIHYGIRPFKYQLRT